MEAAGSADASQVRRTAEALSDEASMVINDAGVRITDSSYLDAVAHSSISNYADMADASCAHFEELQGVSDSGSDSDSATYV